MHPYTAFDQHVIEMKNLGEVLIPYNYPIASIIEENEINIIKCREVEIDGYTAILYYSKSLYEDHYLLTLQIINKYSHFLPFSIVCKIAKKFLGGNLSLIETIQDNRKVYTWNSVVSIEGLPIQNPYESLKDEYKIYDGFKYRYASPQSVNFY